MRDPLRGNQFIALPWQISFGGGGDLAPEQSKSLSLGVIITPSFLPGFRASADYTRIAKTDEITGLGLSQVLANEEYLPGFVVRDAPSPTDIQLGWAGPIQSIRTGFGNLARSRVESLDFQIDYSHDSRALGNFHVYAIATHMLTFVRQLAQLQARITTALAGATAPLPGVATLGSTGPMGHGAPAGTCNIIMGIA